MGDQMPSGFDGNAPGRAQAVPRSSAAPSVGDGDDDDMPVIDGDDPVAAHDSDGEEVGDDSARVHEADAADKGCVFRLPVKTKRTVYAWYVKEMEARKQPAYSEPNFTSYWKVVAPHVKIMRRGKDNFSACNACIQFKNQLLLTSLSKDERRRVQERWGRHLQLQMLQRHRYEAHKGKAKDGEVLSVAIDAAASHTNGTLPHYGRDNPKKESSRQRLEFKPMVCIMHYVGLFVLCAGNWLQHG